MPSSSSSPGRPQRPARSSSRRSPWGQACGCCVTSRRLCVCAAASHAPEAPTTARKLGAMRALALAAVAAVVLVLAPLVELAHLGRVLAHVRLVGALAEAQLALLVLEGGGERQHLTRSVADDWARSCTRRVLAPASTRVVLPRRASRVKRIDMASYVPPRTPGSARARAVPLFSRPRPVPSVQPARRSLGARLGLHAPVRLGGYVPHAGSRKARRGLSVGFRLRFLSRNILSSAVGRPEERLDRQTQVLVLFRGHTFRNSHAKLDVGACGCGRRRRRP